MSSDDLQDQLSHYIRFIEKVLRPKLLNAESEAGVVRAEIANYEDLAKQMNERAVTPLGKEEEPMESMVDLGHETLLCNAVVREPNKIFVRVGMGFHVELTPGEASDFSKKRISFLRSTKLSEKESEIKEIKGHIHSASMILDRLHAEMERS